MKNFEGVTTITSREYRELIEDSMSLRDTLNRRTREAGKADLALKECEKELAFARERIASLEGLRDFYFKQIQKLQEQLSKYEEVDNGEG